MRKCSNWLYSYLEMTEVSEAPETYHLWVGITCLSAAVRRRVWLPHGVEEIYPNLFIVLVGPSGSRKSTALGIGKKLINALEKPITQFGQKGTPQAVIQALAPKPIGPDERKESHGLILASEFAEFLGPDAEKNGMFAFLCNLYDSQDHWAYHTVGRGWEHIDYAYVVLLGASAPEQLQGLIPQRAVRGGFGARLIIIPGAMERCIPNPPTTPIIEHPTWVNLVHDLNLISELEGYFSVEDDAAEWFKWWYTEARNVFHASPIMASWEARKGTTIKKLAMLNAIAAGDELVITKDDYTTAQELLKSIEAAREHLLEAATMTEAGRNQDFVRSLLSKRQGWWNRSEILRKVQHRFGGLELRSILGDLQDAGLIEKEVGKSTKQGGRRPMMYRIKTTTWLNE